MLSGKELALDIVVAFVEPQRYAMKRTVFTIAAMLAWFSIAVAQPRGSVQGTVIFRGNGPVGNATVLLSGVIGEVGQHHHPHFSRLTNDAGQFGFSNAPAGVYCISAAHPMNGHAASVIEVLGGQTTNVTLILQLHDSTWQMDSLAIVQLAGRAQVAPRDTTQPPYLQYALDVDEDRTPDYRLSFGPPWYDPPGNAHRPDNGDDITIVGGLFTYADPPTVVVYMINNAEWRDIQAGEHGGYGGYRAYEYERCDSQTDSSNVLAQTNPRNIEMLGVVEIPVCEPPPNNPPGVFAFRITGSENLIYINLGIDWAGIPGNGLETVHVVGGLVPPTSETVPWVIVYEVNGEFVREPGDTTNLVSTLVSADPPPSLPIPASQLMAVNYPNPFNPVTTIEYSLPLTSRVEVKIFDLGGREIAQLVRATQSAGTYQVTWDGSSAPSGIYIYRVTAGKAVAAGRMVLLK
jgi:hypothetical protein